jgi:DNA-binding GntR family transcriptional regulator
VALTTGRGIRDVYWAHGIFAGELAARAWDAKTDALLATLHEKHAAYQEALKRRDGASLTAINGRFHAAINSVAASPTIGAILRNTLQYFPDFSIPVKGWNELASRWQEELITEFTSGDREGARRVSIECSKESGELFVKAYWS